MLASRSELEGGGGGRSVRSGGGVDITCTTSPSGDVLLDCVLGLSGWCMASRGVCGLVVLYILPGFLFKLVELQGWTTVTGQIPEASTGSGGEAAGWGLEGGIAGPGAGTRHIPCSTATGRILRKVYVSMQAPNEWEEKGRIKERMVNVGKGCTYKVLSLLGISLSGVLTLKSKSVLDSSSSISGSGTKVPSASAASGGHLEGPSDSPASING